MDKSKAIKLIEDADICVRGYLRNGCRDLLPMALEKLHEAKEELQKPDWISVEDKLPEYKEKVLACNNAISAYYVVTNRHLMSDAPLDKNGFLKGLGITHWRKIDKLEV